MTASNRLNGGGISRAKIVERATEGTDGNDFFPGTSGDDVINGNGGDDTINDGGGGNDVLNGGDGDENEGDEEGEELWPAPDGPLPDGDVVLLQHLTAHSPVL